MLSGAVHGYRGLVRQILAEIRQELGEKRVPVIATGGYADLIAAGLPEIGAVRPNLTLDGLRIRLRFRRAAISTLYLSAMLSRFSPRRTM